MTYYELLGVSQDSGFDEIKSKYRKLAMKYHPDRNSGDRAAEEKFKQISEAYEILSDSEKRKNYDRELYNKNAGKNGNNSEYNKNNFNFNPEDFENIFSEYFSERKINPKENDEGKKMKDNVNNTFERFFKPGK